MSLQPAEPTQSTEHIVQCQEDVSATTNASIATPSLTLPIEVWEFVIDHLWYHTETLKACTLVCKLWYLRSRFHLLESVVLDQRAQVFNLAKIVRRTALHAEAVKTAVIRGNIDDDNGKADPMPHLAPFAMMLAGKLTRLEILILGDAIWEPSGMHPDVLLHLSAFNSVTLFMLSRITFPSMQTFGRVICALPSLQTLVGKNLVFTTFVYDAEFFRKCRPKKLTRINLDGTGMRDTIDFLLATSIAENLERIELGPLHPILMQDVEALGVQRLLRAAGPSLEILNITLVGDELQSPANSAITSQHLFEAPDDYNIREGSVLDLAHNIHLVSVSLQTPLRERTDYTWIHHLLSKIASKKLYAVSVAFDVRAAQDEDIDDRVLYLFSLDQYSELDALLTAPSFSSLQVISFDLWVTADGVMPDQESWAERVRLRLPRLDVQGNLFAGIWVRNKF